MEFQTNKGTLMQSSVSANIITQLGYLRNYARKGHFFLTSVIFFPEVLGFNFLSWSTTTNPKRSDFCAFAERLNEKHTIDYFLDSQKWVETELGGEK